MQKTKHVDLLGLKCPAPIVQLMREIQDIEAGDELRVLASDPAFPPDVESWCRRTGHELLRLEKDAETYTATIRKSA